MLRLIADEPESRQPAASEGRSPAFPAAPLPSALTSLVGQQNKIRGDPGPVAAARPAAAHPDRTRRCWQNATGHPGRPGARPRLSGRHGLRQPGPIRDPALVMPTIGRALGVADTAPERHRHLHPQRPRARRGLLILDNLEQVIAIAPALATLLASCPSLTILATSREVLHLSVEYEYQVPPLGDAAVDLLVARAHSRARRCPAVCRPISNTVSAICARLDGLPLAIELAATRLRHLSPEIAPRPDRRPVLVAHRRLARPARPPANPA